MFFLEQLGQANVKVHVDLPDFKPLLSDELPNMVISYLYLLSLRMLHEFLHDLQITRPFTCSFPKDAHMISIDCISIMGYAHLTQLLYCQT
mgnify:CR=1 FL=1